jgi:phospholipase D1/2
VLPRETAGWLEQVTMDVLRARLLERLRQADRHGRLKIYYPDIPGLADECVCVHAKVMIVDDKLVRVGSSNLSNRSMSLDAECDVAIEAGGDKRIVSAIRRFRDRLLAEHLGVTPAEVANTVNGNESFIKGIEALRSSQRTLRDLDGRVPEFLERQIPESALIDPERPMDADRLIAELGISDERSQAHYSWLRLLVLVIGLIALAAAWRWTPMADQLDAGKIVSVLSNVRQSPMGPLLAVAAFVIGGLVVAPVTVLIVATALVFGPLLGFACSLVGTLLSAIVVYGIGRLMKRDTARWFSGSRLNRLSQRLARRGLVSIVAVRIIPVAPFTVVNLVAGVSHVSFRDFVLGTLVGMTPGLVAMVIFADRLHDALIEPNLITIALVLAVVVAITVLAYFMRQWLTGNSVGDNSQRGHQR